MFRGLFHDSNDSLSSTETHESQLSDTVEPPSIVTSRPPDVQEVINMAQVQEDIEKPNDNSIPNQISGEELGGESQPNASSSELDNLKIRRRYLRANLTKAITKFQACIEEEEDIGAIFGAHTTVKLRFEALNAVETKIQKLSPLNELEVEI